MEYPDEKFGRKFLSDVRHCGGKRRQRDGDEKLRRQPLPIARPNVQLRRLALTRDSRTRSAPSNFIHFYVGLRMFTSNGKPAGTSTRALNIRGGSLPFALLSVALLVWGSLGGTWGPKIDANHSKYPYLSRCGMSYLFKTLKKTLKPS